MKPFSKYAVAVIISAAIIGLNSCKKTFLEPQPFSRYSPEQLQSKKGIEGLLVATYGAIDGAGTPGSSGWMVGATNWV
ncbi:MAG: RagB/SusD domain protein, partial [Segetibacter sp.]|nr:RagB/SusD domain protein [Segetibacter sp.]